MRNKISQTKRKLDLQSNFTRRNYLDDVFNNFFNDIIDISYLIMTFNSSQQKTFDQKLMFLKMILNIV